MTELKTVLLYVSLFLSILAVTLSIEGVKTIFDGYSVTTLEATIGNLSVNNITSDVNIKGNLHVQGNVSFKRPYLMLSSNQTQIMSSASTPYIINFTTIEDDHLINLVDYRNITVLQQGDYLIEVSAIFTVDSPNKKIELWIQKNGVNVPRSNTIMTLPTANTEIPLAVMFIVDLLTTDNLRFMMATDNGGSELLYDTKTSYSPETPSIIITMSKISEITH